MGGDGRTGSFPGTSASHYESAFEWSPDQRFVNFVALYPS